MAKHHGRLELTWTDKDKTLLSVGDGKYDYTFVDPADHRASEVRLFHEVDRIEGPMPVDRDPELPNPTAGNLLITGDAMHALDALAKNPEYADEYVGKVRLVYIDPPFNTKKTFTDYEDNIEHSIWLTMLRDRLRQIKPLMADDGVIWVHLDDAELHRCRSVMDEELGAEHFLGTVIWQKADSPRSDLPNFSVDHDTMLVYGKTAKSKLVKGARDAALNAIYKSADGDPAVWYDGDPTAPSAIRNQTWVYAVQSPVTGELMYPAKSRCWGTKQETLFAAMSEYADYELKILDDDAKRAEICGVTEGEVRKGIPAIMLAVPLEQAQKSAAKRKEQGMWPEYIIRPKGTLGRKRPQPDTGTNTRTLWFNDEVGHNREAKAEIKALFPGRTPFATPKPERLLRKVIEASTLPGEIVLDCFAGSGTTAAVAHKLGRRWVTTELIVETADNFTKPRLTKVVLGEDPGGVTNLTERVAAPGVELPDAVSSHDAHDFQRVLGKVLESDDDPYLRIELDKHLIKSVRAANKSGDGPLTEDETKTLLALLKKVGTDPAVGTLDVTKQVKSQLNRLTKTTENSTQVWHGGGGFTHLRVGPSMFVDVAGMVLLADWATQGELARAMCAQIGVRYRPDGIYAAKRGRTRYVIVDGMVGVTTVASIVDRLPDNETVEIWATQIEDDTTEALRTARPGSRLELIPDAVLDNYRRTAARKSPFGKGSRALSDETNDERTAH